MEFIQAVPSSCTTITVECYSGCGYPEIPVVEEATLERALSIANEMNRGYVHDGFWLIKVDGYPVKFLCTEGGDDKITGLVVCHTAGLKVSRYPNPTWELTFEIDGEFFIDSKPRMESFTVVAPSEEIALLPYGDEHLVSIHMLHNGYDEETGDDMPF